MLYYDHVLVSYQEPGGAGDPSVYRRVLFQGPLSGRSLQGAVSIQIDNDQDEVN